MSIVTPEGLAQAHVPKVRVALWDNARFVFIVLVVVGHLISTIRTDTALGFGLYAYIYLFHMPAMILLSGLFAKPDVTPKVVRSTVQLAVVWLLWEGIWAVIKFVVNGQTPGKGFLVNPSWTLWFLVTLITLRIVFPYIVRLRNPLAWSVAIALLGALSPTIGTEFSAARTLAFLPFFVLGWLVKDRGWLDRPWFMAPRGARWAGWGILAVVAAVFVALPQLRSEWRIDRWLTHRDSYEWMFANAPLWGWQPVAPWAVALGGIAVAALLMVVAVLMTGAVLLVVSRRHTVATTWGTRTLFVYLLHGPIVWGLREGGVIDAIGEWGVWGILLLTVGGVVLAVILSTAWVARLFRPIIEPAFSWILEKERTG